MFDGFLYFTNGRTEAGEISSRLQPVHRSTAGTTETTEIYGIRPAGKIGKHKAVPPQTGPAMRAQPGLRPGKISAKASNILDADGNRQYQWINSLQELLLLPGGSDGPGLRSITPLLFYEARNRLHII